MKRTLRKALQLCVFLFFLSGSAVQHVVSQDAKPAPPDEDQRQATMQLLQEVYKAEYLAADTAEAKSALAEKILSTAKETDDTVARYLMLKLAADIAVQAADTRIVTEAINTMDQLYEIDDYQLRLAALTAAVKRVTADTEAAAASSILDFCTRAIDRNDYDSAIELLSLSARSIRSKESRDRLSQLATRVQRLQMRYQSVREHLATLLQEPDDPEANLAVGKYRCFTLNQWQTGLRNLAKGSDETLKQIAEMELAGSKEFRRQTEVADRWWDHSQQLAAEDARQVKLHAGYFYKQAMSSLQGLQKAKAETRLREAESLGTIRAPVAAPRDDEPPKADEPKPMTQRKLVYDLPASFSEMAVGGSGQYLIFRLDSLKKLAFFDVKLREITQYVPLETSDVRFTAGAQEFFILVRPQNVIQRWSLKTFKRMSTVKLPLEHPVEALAMGYASTGPIYAGAPQGPGVFLNGRTLKPIPYQVVDHQYQRAGEIQGAGPESRVTASGNGRAFAMWRTNVSPGGFRTYIITDRLVHTFYQHDTMGYIAPSPDGELMYTSRGVYTSQTKEFLANKGNFATSFRVPAVTGSYAVGVPRDDDRKKKNITPVHILVSGQVDPILTIPDISIRPGGYGDFHGRELLTLARRIFLLPQANLIITIPESNKSLILHNVDLEEELNESGVDYLYVVSRAPTSVTAGGTYKYQIQAKSKGGKVQFEIVSGPPGMRVSDSGLVTWRTSRRTTGQHDVIVSIKGVDDQQTTHTFKLTVES